MNIPRILEYSWSTFDFFETAYCAIIHEDEIQIEPIDVFAFFLLDEIGMGTFSDYHDYLAMLPKGADRYHNFVTLNFRYQFQPKLSFPKNFVTAVTENIVTRNFVTQNRITNIRPCFLHFVTLNRAIKNQRPKPCQLNCYLNRVFNCHYSKM